MTTEEQAQLDALTAERDAFTKQVAELTATNKTLTQNVGTLTTANTVYKNRAEAHDLQHAQHVERIRVLKASPAGASPRERVQVKKDLAAGKPELVALADAPEPTAPDA